MIGESIRGLVSGGSFLFLKQSTSTVSALCDSMHNDIDSLASGVYVASDFCCSPIPTFVLTAGLRKRMGNVFKFADLIGACVQFSDLQSQLRNTIPAQIIHKQLYGFRLKIRFL